MGFGGEKTIDPAKIIVVFGDHQVTGYADGTYLSIEPMSDKFTSVAGANGEVARAINQDPRCTITLTLLQTSESNDYLTEALEYDAETGEGALPLYMRDLLGNSVYQAASSWVKKSAKADQSKEVQAREWTLEAITVQNYVGGN